MTHAHAYSHDTDSSRRSPRSPRSDTRTAADGGPAAQNPAHPRRAATRSARGAAPARPSPPARRPPAAACAAASPTSHEGRVAAMPKCSVIVLDPTTSHDLYAAARRRGARSRPTCGWCGPWRLFSGTACGRSWPARHLAGEKGTAPGEGTRRTQRGSAEAQEGWYEARAAPVRARGHTSSVVDREEQADDDA